MSSIQRRFWDEIIQNGGQLAKGPDKPVLGGTNRFWENGMPRKKIERSKSAILLLRKRLNINEL